MLQQWEGTHKLVVVTIMMPLLHGDVGVVGGGAIVLINIINVICKIVVSKSNGSKKTKQRGLGSPSNHLTSSCS
jgi:hypothetical protein